MMRFTERTQKLFLGDGITSVLYWRDVVRGYGFMVRRIYSDGYVEDGPTFYTHARASAANAIDEKVRMYGGIAKAKG